MSPESVAGRWTIITGASSGIGKALAFEFAAGGFNLLLIARNAASLADVAAECVGKYGIEAEVVPADLSRMESIETLVMSIASKPRRYEVLVNNAGFGIHGDFASTDIEQNIQLLNVQLTAALRLTKAVLPSMLSRRSGRILNVASVYSFSPVPFQSVYGACKAFLLSFSSSLQNELKGTGVSVTVFCPGVTQTEFRSRAGIGEKRQDSGMTAQAAAQIAYVETMRGKHVVVPGLVNRVFVFFAQVLPKWSVPTLVRFINRQRGQNHS
ncbi:MAG TPA: SDR family oxidoreductase [Terriglobia bacterium]|nr:SDR family oxidoreductase [Terriglobia bacterium]